jgi:enoyl-CoA hydratase
MPHKYLDDSSVAREAHPVVVKIDEPVAVVTLNRPSRRNSLNLAAWRALVEIAARLATMPTVRAIVLTGQGDAAFSSGSDITEFPRERLGIPAARRYGELVENALEAWLALPQPVVARIHGYCLGAGLQLALTADFRLASDDASFGIPAVKLGIGISVADARRLVDVVGPARARALLLTGEILSSADARAIGLVDDVAPAHEISDRVQARVATLLPGAPHSLAWVKRAVGLARRYPDTSGLDQDEALGTAVFATRDCAEGVAAFLSDRRPLFEGR